MDWATYVSGWQLASGRKYAIGEGCCSQQVRWGRFQDYVSETRKELYVTQRTNYQQKKKSKQERNLLDGPFSADLVVTNDLITLPTAYSNLARFQLLFVYAFVQAPTVGCCLRGMKILRSSSSRVFDNNTYHSINQPKGCCDLRPFAERLT